MSTLRREGAWAVLDQVLSSGTNFIPSLILARVLGPAGYGVFSLVFIAWFSSLAFITSALMQPYTLAAAPIEGAAWRDVTKHASGTVVLAGLLSSGIFAVVALVVGMSSDLGRALLVIAILAPGLVLQEFWRVASYAASRARTATANDGYWAIGQIAAFGFLLWHGHPSVVGCLLAWGAPASLAAGLGVMQLSVMPRVDLAAIRWARKWMRLGAWFTFTSTTYTIGLLVVAIIIETKLGKGDLGRFQTVQNLFGPIQLLVIGGQSVFVPYLVRKIKSTSLTGLREARLYSLLIAASVAAYGLVVLLDARTILTKVFGASYEPAVILVLPTLLSLVLDAGGGGAALKLRAQAKGRSLALGQLTATLTRIAAVYTLIIMIGFRGAAWGLMIGSAVGCGIVWVLAYATDRSKETAEVSAELWQPNTD